MSPNGHTASVEAQNLLTDIGHSSTQKREQRSTRSRLGRYTCRSRNEMRLPVETDDAVYFDPDDLEGIYQYLLSAEAIHVSEEMRFIVETHWPELAHKLVPPSRKLH
jgi:hypothetical protein